MTTGVCRFRRMQTKSEPEMEARVAPISGGGRRAPWLAGNRKLLMQINPKADANIYSYL